MRTYLVNIQTIKRPIDMFKTAHMSDESCPTIGQHLAPHILYSNNALMTVLYQNFN